MEDYLTELYEKDGVAIFHTDYQLLLKLLLKFTKNPLRNDAYCINALLGGNVLYKSIVTAQKSEGHTISRVEYNVLLAQTFSADCFWKYGCGNPERIEQLLRMIYEIAGITLAGVPMTITSTDIETAYQETLINELNSAVASYNSKRYPAAFEKGKKLFDNGMTSAATLLSRCYYHGNGTHKDYNKALYYLTYPHKRSKEQDKMEYAMLDNLLELRDKSMYCAAVCLVGSLLTFIFMIVTGFFVKRLVFALFNTVLLIAGSVLFIMSYKRKLIFDFSYWLLILGCMFLIILML